MTNNKLEDGEQYLSIILLGGLRIAAFPNKNKTDNKQPDYKGDGVAIWISKKKPIEMKMLEN